MASPIGLLQLSLLALLAATVFGSATSGAAYLALRGRFAGLAPASRARAVLLFAAAPGLLGVFLTIVCFLPSVLLLAGHGSGDHCATHPDHHVHLCLVHPPHDGGSTLGWMVLGVLACGAVVLVGRHASLLRRSRRDLGRLLSMLGSDGRGAVTWIRSSRPIALTAGVLRPRTFVSHGLRNSLPTPLLEAVLQHETAHRRRRDVLCRAGAGLFALLHWPAVRRRLLDDLHLAGEQAADAEAAAAIGSPLLVAEAILAVERLGAKHACASLGAAAAFGEGGVSARVERLLSPETSGATPFVLSAAILAGVGLLLAGPIHHVVETLLTPLAG